MVEVYVVIGNWQAAGPTNLVFSFQHPELDRPRNMSADITQGPRFGQRLGNTENGAFVSEYPTRSMLDDSSKGKRSTTGPYGQYLSSQHGLQTA